jgi:hypothetical protein
VTAAASAALSAREASLTWTLSSLTPTIFDRCEYLAPDGTEVIVELLVNGDSWYRSACDPTGGSDAVRLSAETWSAKGLQQGDRFRITLRLVGAERADAAGARSPAELPQAGMLAVAIGEPVPFADYPLPPRPSVLPPLSVPYSGNGPAAGREDAGLHLSDPADPLRPVSVPIVWTGSFDISLALSTPGNLRLSIAGIDVTSCDTWTYDGNSCGIGWSIGERKTLPWLSRITAKPGEPVLLTVTPEHVSGAWGVRITAY